MSRINLEFNGASSNSIFVINTKEILNYETDNQKIHELFGGEQYYSSHSGLSGAGYIFQSPKNPVIKLGYYRTDIKGVEQHPEMFRDKFLYAPVKGHDGYDPTKPIIISDGGKVVFTDPYNLAEDLQSFDTLNPTFLIEVESRGDYYGGYYSVAGRHWGSFNPRLSNIAHLFRFTNLRYCNAGKSSYTEPVPGASAIAEFLGLQCCYGQYNKVPYSLPNFVSKIIVSEVNGDTTLHEFPEKDLDAWIDEWCDPDQEPNHLILNRATQTTVQVMAVRKEENGTYSSEMVEGDLFTPYAELVQRAVAALEHTPPEERENPEDYVTCSTPRGRKVRVKRICVDTDSETETVTEL